ncbi:MAG: thioredoxin domain-containing protein, partial [Promethearchaeota archaeon]
GFHRYSTDSSWLVPHFEKMLYDQALIAIAYIEAYQATKKELYKKTAKEIFTYVLRDMLSPEGGFYSAEDADSEGKEGKFYVWSKKELREVLNKEEGDLAIDIFNIKDTGNFSEEATGKSTDKNIIHTRDIPKEKIQQRLNNIRAKLYKEREKRIRPHRDDKILTDWNGLMIAALAKASIAFKEDKYLRVAKNAVNFILSKLRDSDKNLLHRFKGGVSEINGFLTDYTFFIWGLIELYEATFELTWIKLALELHQIQIENFWDEDIGGFYFTADKSEILLTRQKEIYDGAIPSGNSIALLNLLRLSYFTGDHELEEKADILNRVFSEKIKSNPLAYTQYLVAIDFAIGPSYSLVIGGNKNAKDTKEMIKAINAYYVPNKVFILRNTEHISPEIDNLSNFVQFFDNLDGKATAYVCINKTCKPPTHDVDKMLEYLESKWN